MRWILSFVLFFVSIAPMHSSGNNGGLLHDDRIVDDDLFRRYSYVGGFHYNDYYEHEYSHLFNYNYYYYSDPLNIDAYYVGSIHTTELAVESVSISGNTIMASGYSHTVSVFDYKNSKATFSYTMVLPPAAFSNSSGFPSPLVAVDGNRSVVYGYRYTIFVYELVDGLWSCQSTLYHPMAMFDGAAVALSGDVIVASASLSGNVTVYEFDGEQWSVSVVIHGGKNFGQSVALSGQNLLVSNRYSAGVHHYARINSSNWELQSLIDGKDFDESFGESLALSGDTAVIGTSGPHVTYLYRLIDGQWVFQNMMDSGSLALALDNNLCLVVDLLKPQSIRVYELVYQIVGSSGTDDDSINVDDDVDSEGSLNGKRRGLSKTDTIAACLSVAGGVALILAATLCVANRIKRFRIFVEVGEVTAYGKDTASAVVLV